MPVVPAAVEADPGAVYGFNPVSHSLNISSSQSEPPGILCFGNLIVQKTVSPRAVSLTGLGSYRRQTVIAGIFNSAIGDSTITGIIQMDAVGRRIADSAVYNPRVLSILKPRS